jgi:hypothetical protein
MRPDCIEVTPPTFALRTADQGAAIPQLRPPPPARDIAHRDGDGLLLPDQYHKPLAAGDPVVAGYSEPWLLWMLAAYAQYQGVEFAKPLRDRATVKAGSEFAFLRLDVPDKPDAL